MAWARVLLQVEDMTHDDAHTSHNHGFALPAGPQVVVRSESRPWRVVAGVAVCLGLAGVIAGLIVARRQSLSDEHLISDALQREELRDGWRALGAAAALEAQTNAAQANITAAQASTAESVAAAPPNVVIVNVPAQSTTAAPNVAASAVPAHVTNINLASGAPNQSLPSIDFSPVPGYVPMQPGYTSAPASDTAQPSASPQYSGTTATSGVQPLTPPVGNGSIPGSAPNPALPNNGLVGSSPVPGLPNGPANSSPPPSGFSAP